MKNIIVDKLKHLLLSFIMLTSFSLPAYPEDNIPKYILSQVSKFKNAKEMVVTPDIPQIEDIDSLAIIEPLNLTDEPDISLQLHNLLVKYFLKTNRFKVLERTRLDKILEEQQLGLTGIIDEKKASKIGALLGAKALLSGEIIFSHNADDLDLETNKKTGSHAVYNAHLKLVSVERGVIIWNEIISFDQDSFSHPKTIESYLHKLLLRPKTIKLRAVQLLSFYDRVRGAGQNKYVFISSEEPALVLDVENAKYVTLSYSLFKKGYSKPKMGGSLTSLDEDNLLVNFNLSSVDTLALLAKVDGLNKFQKRGTYIIEISANDKVIHEIHFYCK
ncbi:MAG: hypothetical protein A3D30_01360 [Deltaproteobacteria bacterium RIFCSPHIGHO2_02_FULL_43_33]|nr:MAG: hypothetical protein A3D30_01360 [Deltaproteobacteria bacterium RIFCSPHIGHO2_02_FULL_43_33]